MKTTIILKKIISSFILLILFVQISACGYILYPERRGQTGGRIDPGIAVLDGVALLLFVVPGVIAFAVDFSTGCIYLPGTEHADNPGSPAVRTVYVDPVEINEKTIKEIIARETGITETIDLNTLTVYDLHGSRELPERFAEIKQSGYQKNGQ